MPSQASPLAGLPLDYLIGADGPQSGKGDLITETPYGVRPAAGGGCSIAYCNLRREEGEPAEYGPYLPHDDIYHQYHEGRPDPAGHGFERNILEQLDRCKELGHTLVEQDNPDSYPLYAVLRGLDLAQQRGLGVVAKNPGLLKDGALDYVAHQNVFGIIVEKDCGSPQEMEALRRRANKPDLPVWFVSFGDGRSWAREAAQDIQVAGYANMGVTYSGSGEYGNSEDVLPPMPVRMPQQAAAIQPRGATGMDTTQAQTILSNIGPPVVQPPVIQPPIIVQPPVVQPPVVQPPVIQWPQPMPADWVADIYRRIQQLEKVVTDAAALAPQLSEVFTKVSQLNTQLGGLRLPQAGAAGTPPILSPIDKLLGGEALVGLKTPLAIVAYAGLWILQTMGQVGTVTGDKATTTGQVLTGLIAAFGGLGLSAKIDRAVKGMSAIAGAAQNTSLPPPGPGQG